MSDFAFYLTVFLVWSLMGFILIGVGIHTRRYQRRKEMTERTSVPGTIVDRLRKVYHAGGRSRHVTYYVPVIEFAYGGRQYRLANENGPRDPDAVGIGQAVVVMIDPEDPTHFHLAEDLSNEKGAESLIRFGLIWIAGAAVLEIVCMVFNVFQR